MKKLLLIACSQVILAVTFGFALVSFELNVFEAFFTAIIMFAFGWSEYELGKELSNE